MWWFVSGDVSFCCLLNCAFIKLNKSCIFSTSEAVSSRDINEPVLLRLLLEVKLPRGRCCNTSFPPLPSRDTWKTNQDVPHNPPSSLSWDWNISPETSSQFLTLSKLDQDQSVCSLVRRQSLLFIYCHVLVHVDDTLSIRPRPQSLHFLTSEMWGRLPCSAHLTECVPSFFSLSFLYFTHMKLEVNTQF